MLNFKFTKKSPNPGRVKEDSAHNPKVLEVNLIKNEIEVSFHWRQYLATLVFSLLVAALFVVEIYVGLNWWAEYENTRIAATEKEFNKVSQEIKSIKKESEEVMAFKERVDLAEALLARHIYWTNFFDWLEKNTLSTVNYGGFSGSTDGSYSFAATTNTFREISWQTRAFLEDPLVLSAKVDSGSGGKRADGDASEESGTISFTLNIEVDPKLFRSAAQ